MSEQEIFAAAIKLTGHQRAAFIQAACGDDETLRNQVSALLSAHDESGGLLPKAADRDLEATRAFVAEAKPGVLIAGKFKLVEMIGEGGMGVIWLAEQKEPVKRKVAVKLIKPGMDSRAVMVRFEAERQALAMMDHPHIAKVFDGGLTAEGRPYFAMELVKGIPVTDYCDQVQFSLRERLTLFGQACAAVQHAHQKGIIHRDLKPSNILVTEHDGKPVIKVIDFGLAKALHGSHALTEHSMHTAFGAVLGTPLYMAPEQLVTSALDVDTRADLYSLGVVLYELLTGATPIERERLKEAAWDEICRLVRDEDPPLPSTRVSSHHALPSLAARRHVEPSRLTKLIRGDLDWIVMKALEKDRNRRYDTATGLAMDIQRYLDGEAVLAAPASRSYRLRKVMRRHAKAISVGALLVGALVAGTAGTTIGMLRARQAARGERAARLETETKQREANRQRARAEQREQQAIDAVKRFSEVVSDNAELKNNPQFESLRRALLKEPLTFFQSLKTELMADRKTRPDSLKRLAAACFTLGDLTEEIGDGQDALRAYEDALAARERIIAQGRTPNALSGCAQVLERIGARHRASGRLDESQATLEHARRIWEDLAREHPANVQYQKGLAGNHYNAAGVMRQRGQRNEALIACQQALTILDRALLEMPANDELLRVAAQIYHGTATILKEMPDGDERSEPADVMATYLKERTVLEQLAAKNSDDASIQSDLARCIGKIGSSRCEAGSLDEGLAELEQAQSSMERLVRDHPTSIEYRTDLGNILHGLGLTLMRHDRSNEARTPLDRALTVRNELQRQNPGDVYFQMSYATTLQCLAELDIQSGELAAARDRLREAVTHQRLAFAATPDDGYSRPLLVMHYDTLRWVANSLKDAQVLDEAEVGLAELLDIPAMEAHLAQLLKGADSASLQVINAVEQLGDALATCGRMSDSLALLMDHGRTNHVATTARGADDGALKLLMQRALDYDAPLGNDIFEVGGLGELQHVAGNFELAETTLRSAFKLKEDAPPWLHKSLGMALLAQGRIDEARSCFEASLAAFKLPDGKYDVDAADYVERVGAYFLDLMSEEEFVASTAGDPELACYPWFYVGQRREFAGDLAGDLAGAKTAYKRCADLGDQPWAEKTVVFAKCRLADLAQSTEP